MLKVSYVYVLVHFIGLSNCLFIIGCPLYGCRPSGTFSMYHNVPRENASIAWETKFSYDPVPRALGCVANDVNIICQSNGPFDEDKGYVCVDGWNGTIQWRDKVLRFPTLPIMDNYGDVTGSDGISLVHYDQNGKLFPVIPCKGMKPIFSMTLVSTHFLLQVSENGGFSVRETNAIPDAFIFLNATVQGIKGTFLPISQPVVNASRFYVLTEFVADNASKTVPVQRVYAIDIHNRMAEIMTVAWYYQFKMQNGGVLNKHLDEDILPSKQEQTEKLLFKTNNYPNPRRRLNSNDVQRQSLMWDGANGLLYITLPALYCRQERSSTDYTFWALKDLGNDTSLAYRKASFPVTHMTMFEDNTDVENWQVTESATIWVSLSDGRLVSLSINGTASKIVNLPALLGADVDITSKLVTARSQKNSSDILIMGVKFSNQSRHFYSVMNRYGINLPTENITSALIAVDTSMKSTSIDVIMWVVPIPGNLVIKGQISGSSGASTMRKDRIIVYAEEEGKYAKIIAIE